MYSEAALPEAVHQDIPPVDEIEEHRPAETAERGIKQSRGGSFVGSNDRSNLRGDAAGSRQYEASEVLSHKSKLWQPTE